MEKERGHEAGSCQMGVRWVSGACRRGDTKEDAVRRMTDGCQMHVGEETGRRKAVVAVEGLKRLGSCNWLTRTSG